jgi:hypothetical protein
MQEKTDIINGKLPTVAEFSLPPPKAGFVTKYKIDHLTLEGLIAYYSN